VPGDSGAAERAPGDAAAPDPTTLEPTPAAPSAEEVSPPRVLAARLAYPEGATGSARVLLELVIERDGSVRSARVTFGLEPFASAAALAAREFRFDPARRGGQAVPARIHFEVQYTPPAAAPAELPSAPASAASVPVARVTEVQVLGEVTPGAVGLSSVEARMLPGAFGDPFRAVGVLPGVGQLVTGLPVFYVRGAPAGNLGFFVDGVRVPLLFHAFLGPAVVHPRLLERTELHAGGYPASLGRFAGGVVTADLSEPRGEFNGEWSARLLDAGLFFDVPFAGGKGNIIAAGRYSYTLLLLSLLGDQRLDYWDYQVLASYDLSRRGKLSVFAFGSYDYAGAGSPRRVQGPGVFSDEQDTTLDTGESALLFHRIDLRYDHRFSEGTKLRAATTIGVDATRGAQGRVRDRMGGARLELRSQLSRRVLLRAGASAGADTYDLRLDPNTEHFLDVIELFPSRTDTVLGAHADLVLQVAPGVSVTPGLRVDRYQSLGRSALGISPRLSASFRLNDAVSIEHQLGLADQPPNFVPGIPGVSVAGLPGGLQRALQHGAGVRAALPAGFQGRLSLFQNAFFQVTDPFGQTQDLDLDVNQARIRSLGHAYGLELLLQRPISERFGALLSYTLSRSTRSHDRVHTLSGYDRTHVLNLGGSYDVGAHWIGSAQAVMYSGVPGSRRQGEDKVFDRSRAPLFLRADLRLEKRFLLEHGAWWGVVAELMNATLSREVLRRNCERRCRDEEVGPIFLPNLGVSGQF
jgi:hypothetical protein